MIHCNRFVTFIKFRGEKMVRIRTRITVLLICILSLFTIFLNVPGLSTEVSAANTVTSFGLAQHAIKAYNDGWIYNYGSKGEKNSSGVRMSDCSGLICAFFTDNGITRGLGGVNTLLKNKVASGDIYSLPRVHGLLITIPNNDHVGVYIGNGDVVDNSSTGVNMLWGKIFDSSGNARRRWNMWHILDNGIKYAWSGFYAFNGKMYHYTEGQYDINKSVTYNGTTYKIGSDGIVCNSSGSPIAVNNSMTNSGYVSASKIAGVKGSGSNATVPDGTPATVIGSGVNLRKESNTSSSVVTTLYKGTTVYVTNSSVAGQSITSEGKTSSTWYKCNTSSGLTGYMSSLFVTINGETPSTPPVGNEVVEEPPTVNTIEKPTLTYSGGKLTMKASKESAAIYYTTDCSAPSEKNGSIYGSAISVSGNKTYKAIAVDGSSTSAVANITIMKNGMAFSDIQINQWYFATLEAAIDSGLMSGKGSNIMAPNQNMTRAEFIKILAEASGANYSSYKAPSFTDVPVTAWYAKVLAWAQDKEYIKPYADGTFKPNAAITREEMCVILAKFAGLNNTLITEKFSDESLMSADAINAIYACRDSGIISGVGANQFNPKGSTTRAQAAKVAITFMEYID